MSLLVLGVSHRSAPIGLLESVALDPGARVRLADAVVATEHVTETVILSTCNRTEVYADVSAFHGGLSDVTDALVSVTGMPRAELVDQLYVHYEDRAIAHAFSVACGLDSMAVGEAQILGQMREALTEAQRHGHVAASLNALLQQALRVGKRAHTETAIDQVSVSLVEAGLAHAERVLGPLDDLRVLVVGAGGMSSLAATTAARLGVARLVVVNRTPSRARRLADRVGAQALPFEQLDEALAAADVVITSTGAAGLVVDLGAAQGAQRARRGEAQVYLDLALPHDVDLAVAGLRGVTRIGLADLQADLRDSSSAPQVQEVTELVLGEVAAYLAARSAQAVAPTVAALRARAADVVESELTLLTRRTAGMSPADREEVHRSVHRIVEKLLHTPTVRVKQHAAGEDGGRYAAALRDLFDLDPRDTAAVSTPPSEAVDLP
ncbi:Glutamyl-tRNA reductase [Nostocoides japonicum T1-X7]|uniref:Glutamyl-tRNA reductase n=1 Tax=Nostocoides japonicum T1-X7 TaxID=1194083 RepID=A0A077LY39_9MICO|nr:glutamyl-tRNA reductase [Tetrasphaera japonica]CCH77822.1 Glutamyl-tRNA reductase [Tetrasphaera japonica T1-X7]